MTFYLSVLLFHPHAPWSDVIVLVMVESVGILLVWRLLKNVEMHGETHEIMRNEAYL